MNIIFSAILSEFYMPSKQMKKSYCQIFVYNFEGNCKNLYLIKTIFLKHPVLFVFSICWHMVLLFRDKVWAVKWYRGNFEIFRFIADETPPTKVFKLDNFDVDVSILLCFQLNWIFGIFSRVCCLMGRHCSWGMSIFIILAATAARWWRTQHF